jgi:UDP-3-O-[3-hydroxymyristoyl] N-acetylglucosamine deacetylase
MGFQKTLKEAVEIKGIGLHSGAPVVLTLRPARPNTGIRFVRTDLDNQFEVAAHYQNVVNTQMATTLGRGHVSISTVEHLLAAVAGLGIDNLRAEVDGPEIPIMDGSSVPFVEAILSVGLQIQKNVRPTVRVRERVEVRANEKWAIIEPSARLEVQSSIEWDHPSIGYQEFHFIEGVTPVADFARARTFGFLKDVEALKRMGLARGGSLENAVVLDHALVLNPDGLRYPNEFARHKVLDALGDFKLAGVAIQGSFKLHRSGHDLHKKILAELFSNPDYYEVIEGASSMSAESPAGIAYGSEWIPSIA